MLKCEFFFAFELSALCQGSLKRKKLTMRSSCTSFLILCRTCLVGRGQMLWCLIRSFFLLLLITYIKFKTRFQSRLVVSVCVFFVCFFPALPVVFVKEEKRIQYMKI